MLLLVTILLVLIAAVTLLIGIFGDNLAFIFVSIGSSIVAALVLGVLSQMTKRQATATAAGAVPAGAGGEPSLAPEPVASTAALDETVAAAGAAPATAATAAATTAVAALPIPDYDALRVNDIMPRLDALDLDQLEAVAQHEESGKNRSSILNRIDQLMDELEAAEAPAAATAAAEVADVEEEPLATATGAAATFPIPRYAALSEDEIVAMLGDLDADELETVAEFEETHANRDRVLDAIDDRLDELEGIAPAAAATTTATATKAATKTVKKAAKGAAKTTKTAKTAATAKKTATRATAAKTTKPTKATKKATSTATAKKATTTARKAAAPAKRTTTAAKTAARPTKAAAKTTKKAAASSTKTAAKKAAAAKKTAKR